MLKESIESLLPTLKNKNVEIIIHDDGSDNDVKSYIFDLVKQKKVSFAIFNAGNNLGIGEAIQKCLKLSSGEFLFKADADIIYKEKWLENAISVLNSDRVGAVSLFNYRNYNREDNRFNILHSTNNYHVVDDFVSSIYGFKRKRLDEFGYPGTDGWHQVVGKKYNLAITKDDYVANIGFGLGNSVWVVQKKDGTISSATIHEEPLMF